MLASRKALTPVERQEATERALRRFQSSAHLIASSIPKVVGLYVPVKGEMATQLLYDWLITLGKKVAFPRVVGDFCVYAVTEWDKLRKGSFGLLEPDPGLVEVDPDWVFVPGIAFDYHGARIGFGHGYFDRTLTRISSVRIGLGYGFQVVHDLPQEPWDQKLDYVLTDEMLIIPQAKGSA